jgi:hypothetical protein
MLLHLFMFGWFFTMLVAGMLNPLGNMRLMNLIRNAFQEGGLEYVGRAFESGNVLLAAAAIFANNYLVQTLALTLAVSLIVPFAGLIKTLASFTLAGFGMAPIWSNLLPVLPAHSITIAVELEAYVVACFAVVLWPVYVVRAVWRSNIREVLHGLSIVGGAAVVTGVILGVAALYEAVTLMTLR